MWFLLIFLALLLAFVLYAYDGLYRYTFCRHAPKLFCRLFDKRGHEDAYYLWRDGLKAELAATPHQTLSIRSARGETLTGYYFPAEQPSQKLAFIVHGFRSDALETAGPFYEYYHSHGYDLFCPDHTAHGASEGEQVGYGIFESEDCLLWLKTLYDRMGEVPTVLHGFSMGGATVLSLADRCPKAVKFIVDDCGFTSFLEAFLAGFGKNRALVGKLVHGPFRLLNRIRAHYDIDATDTRPHVQRSKRPILFVHGEQDKTVPFAMGRELYALCRSEKAFLAVPDARHVESLYRAKAQYERKLDEFAETYL